MTRNHEKLLVATLAGIIIAGAALFAIQPTLASSADSVRTSDLLGPSHAVLLLQLPTRG